MSEETKKIEETGKQGSTPQEVKTFTQEELNAIVGDRVKRERDKYADYEDIKAKAEKFDQTEESNKSELQKATEEAAELQAKLDSMNAANKIRDARDKISKEMNVPANLLTGTDDESCKAQAQAILDYAKKNTYPSVPDGGETGKGTTTKEDILAIKDDSKRIKAIEENIELFTKK